MNVSGICCRGGHWSAAYGAWMKVFKSSISQDLAIDPVQLDNNGVLVPCLNLTLPDPVHSLVMLLANSQRTSLEWSTKSTQGS
jgi:hypothetical protein